MWIGVDGEGLGRDPHRYVLLASSDSEGNTTHIEDLEGLSTDACLDWLLRLPSNANIAGYYLGYDWTMILRDLPNLSIYKLLRPELRQLPAEEGRGFTEVEWKDYKLHFLAGMMRIKHGRRKVTIWDLGKYYQAPFVEALKQWKIQAPAEIATMKAMRDQFTAVHFERIRDYCLDECKCLAELATALEDAHKAVDLHPKSWHGPGSTASAALTKQGIAEKRGTIPDDVEYVSGCAFFGGRFEQSMLGRVDDAIGYDIVSAYPYQTYHLPCLEHGVWKRTKRKRDLERRDVAHACIRYRISDIGKDQPWGPLPCRMASGSILYPQSGSAGWVWRDEWDAAREGWDGVEWGGEAWLLMKQCDCQPFSFILDLFRERIRLGKNGPGRTTKLAINSCYGKLAQSIGKPRFASRVWAGMITSGTRAMLLRAIIKASNREAVYALATDGIYVGEKLDLGEMPLDPDTLGSWEEDPHGPMVFVRPGIYWSEKDETLRARGLGRRTLEKQRDGVMKAIDAGVDRAVIGTSTMFGGARATVYLTPKGIVKRSKFYGQWHDVPARISLDPAPKRAPDWSPPRLDGVESAPYLPGASNEAKTLKMLELLRWASR